MAESDHDGGDPAGRTDGARPVPAADLLVATPSTAYFWARVAGDGTLAADEVRVRTADEQAADALAAIAAADRTTHEVAANRSAHDASVVRYEDEYELTVVGAPAERASAALGLPRDGQPGGYRFDAFDDHRRQLLRGLLESTGTICFRESAGEVGVSFVHDDAALLETIRGLLADAAPAVPAEARSETSSGGYWFGLAEDADVAGFAAWVYEGSEESGLFSRGRRTKLRRSVERATDRDLGTLGENQPPTDGDE